MPYITRNQQHKIQSLYNEAQSEDQEFLPNNDTQVLEFLKDETCNSKDQVFLNQTDTDLIRVLEDLVDLLTEKHVILFTDLPTAAQNKLLQRKSIRRNLQHSILDGEEDNIF
ncbi:MAG: hypothetical protein QM479_13320 [Pseudomonadota bacterium]